MTKDDALVMLRRRDIKYVLAQFVDIHGAAKAKAVPIEHLDMVLGDGAGFAGFALWGFGMGPHGPDYMAVGDLTTLRALPWMPGYARIVCNGTVKGAPWPYCSRVVLKRQLDKLAAEGLTLYTGIEPEFMLLTRDANGALKPFDATDTLDKPCYDYKGLSRASGFLDELTSSLRAAGVDVYQIDHEDANGQFEVNYTYADALTSADNFMLVKMAVSEIARKHGMIGTFMPKPFSNRTGSGAHFHISDGQRGEEQPVPRCEGPAGPGAVGDGLFLPRRLAEARARTDGHLRADGQFVQAAGGGPRALGCDLGAGLHRLRRQQPHRLRAHSGRPARDAAAGLRLQSLPRDRRDRSQPAWMA